MNNNTNGCHGLIKHVVALKYLTQEEQVLGLFCVK